MLTRLRLQPFTPKGDWQKDAPLLVKWIFDYWLSLEQKNALTISQAQVYVDQGLQFPATQVASTDVNNLDDYEEGSSSPAVTSGTGTFTSVSATLTYTKVGRLVNFRITVTITTNGTAATSVQVALPFTAAVKTSLTGYEGTVGKALTGFVNASTASVVNYDNSYPGASGNVLYISGAFEV